MKYRVYISNSAEYELFMKISFALGYKWGGRTDIENIKYDVSHRYLSLWSDGTISHGFSDNFGYIVNMSFDEFIDYIDKNDISYEV